ncbi:hypothetical protein [Psychrobacter sp. FDAARGOS_221]|uniref:hypothetical protein n=1 Tax=Psychrobacter sp. FDAARGOS_221 TaxID=1975705 RepID=UPI000BB59702|nr:hypothetical protein [Psychrobacter sp. FDAARGOS_221]PNK59589.1 hypothetical protein A6J60_000945 [Psychrobacter sp. FDAARGOS_221]
MTRIKQYTRNLLISLPVAMTAVFSATVASAEYEAEKLETIKEMYEIAKTSEVGGAEVYANYASDSLMQAFEMFNDSFNETGQLCNEGMDTMWLSQDADYSVPLEFDLEGEHMVKVTVGDLGVVNYKMVCSELGCAIDDVFTQQQEGESLTSLKRYLLRACR